MKNNIWKTIICAGLMMYSVSGCTPSNSEQDKRGSENSSSEVQEQAKTQEPDETADVPAKASFPETIQNISSSSSTKDIQQAINLIARNTVENSPHGFQLEQLLQTRKTATDMNREFYVKQTQLESIETYLPAGLNLYEVTRTSPSAERTPYVGLIRINRDGSSAISCSFEEGEGITTENPQLHVDLALPSSGQENSISDEELQQSLTGASMQALLPLFGTDLPVSVYEDPSLYSFDLSKEGDGWIWTITPASMEAWNKKLDAAGNRKDLFETGNYMADDFETTACSVILTLDANGVLQSAGTTLTNTFHYEGEEYSTGTERNYCVEKLPEQNGLSTVEALFKQADEDQLPDTIQLDVPVTPLKLLVSQ